jgi:hypothetical protein
LQNMLEWLWAESIHTLWKSWNSWYKSCRKLRSSKGPKLYKSSLDSKISTIHWEYS